jgi:glycerol-3-phosphate dehydrogenase subunit C
MVELLEKFHDVLEQCTLCDACFEACPVSIAVRNETLGTKGKVIAARKLLEGEELSEDEYKSAYLCTRCRKCEVVCPFEIPLPDVDQALRYELMKIGKEPEIIKAIAKRIIEFGNPMGKPAEARDKIVPEGMHATKGVDTVYLTGCWSGYALPDVVGSALDIMTKGRIRFGMLGSKEKCCGLFLIDNAHLDDASKLAEENIKSLEELGANTAVVSCAACHNVYNKMYPELYREPKFEVKHIVEVIAELVDAGKIQFKSESSEPIVAYMDACHIGRCGNIYDEPRKIIKSIPSIELRELPNIRDLASCCGAPAGVKPFAPEISNSIGLNLLKSAQDIGAEELIVSCPFCLYHLNDVKKKFDVKLGIREISQFVSAHMK